MPTRDPRFDWARGYPEGSSVRELVEAFDKLALGPQRPPSPLTSISELQFLVGSWADRVFPQRTPRSTLTKLVLEEIPEFLIAKGEDPGEYADLLILVLDLAHQKRIDAAAALIEKHRVNAGRSWAMNEMGVYHHIGNSVTPKCFRCEEHHAPDVDCRKE